MAGYQRQNFDSGKGGFQLPNGCFFGTSPSRIQLLIASRTSQGTVTVPDTGAAVTLATLEGAQTFTGAKTFSGGAVFAAPTTLPATVAYTSNGSIVKSGNHTLTLTTTGDSNVTFPASGTLATTSLTLGAFAATTSAQLLAVMSDGTGTGLLVFNTSPTFAGTPVFPATITIGANSFIRSGAHNLTLTTTGTTNVTLPTAGTLATRGANTFTGIQSFGLATTWTGGVAANNSVWFASNVLRQRGGTGGWAVDNTSGNAILSITDGVGAALTVGPASGATGVHRFNTVALTTSTAAGISYWRLNINGTIRRIPTYNDA